MPHDSSFAQDRQSLFGAVFDAVPFPVLVHDVDTILFANKGARDVLCAGQPDGLAGRALSDFVHPDARDAGRERRRVMLEQGHTFAGVALKLIDCNGEPVRLVVDARKFSIGADSYIVVMSTGAEESRAWLPALGAGALTFPPGTPLTEAALRALPSPVFVADRERLRMVTQSAALLIGAASADSLEGMPVMRLVQPDSHEAAIERGNVIFGAGAPIDCIDTKLVHSDGSPVYVRAHARPVPHGSEPLAIWWIQRARTHPLDATL
jgi:PAS domain-containing protein